MIANILPEATPWTPGVGSKDQNIFLKVIMLHIKLKEMECRVMQANILSLHTPSTPGMEG